MFRHEKTDERQGSVQPVDVVPILLALTLVAARWPTLFLNEQLNPDESGLIAGALRFMHDPVPWRGADLNTSGPLNAYVLFVPVILGLGLNYFAARFAGLSLLIISVICLYVAAKRVRGKFAALSVMLPLVTFLCFVRNEDFIHYSTELLSIAFLSFVALIVTSLNALSSARLFLAALVLGMVPFAKLQAAPPAVVAFFSIAFFAWWVRGEQFSKIAVVMGAGGLVAPAAVGVILVATATFDDAWRAYVLTGLEVTAIGQGGYNFVYYVLENRAFTFSVAVLALITLAGTNLRFLRQQIQGEGPWLLVGSLVYGLATVYAIYKPGYPWGHYLFFGLPAAVFLATALIAPGFVGSPWQRACAWLRSVVRPTVAAVIFFGTCAAFGLLMVDLRVAPLALKGLSKRTDDSIAKIVRVLLRDDSHFAVWGWMPKYYAITGIRPTTRDVLTFFQTWEGPQQEYYRVRYLADFNRFRPNIFVDATGPGNFFPAPYGSFAHSHLEPFEKFNELSKIIHSDYVLLLDIEQCGTPRTRIFVSKTRLSELNAEVAAISKAPICLQDSNDLARLLALLK